MKDKLIQHLTGIQGRITTLAGGYVLAKIAEALAPHGWSLDPAIAELISLLIGLGVAYVIDNTVFWLNAKGVKEIQKALPDEVKVDGVPGEKTLEAVKEAVAVQNEVQNTPP